MEDMENSSKSTSPIIFGILCSLFSLIMGIIGGVEGTIIIFRIILFFILGTLGAHYASKILEKFLISNLPLKEDEDMFAPPLPPTSNDNIINQPTSHTPTFGEGLSYYKRETAVVDDITLGGNMIELDGLKLEELSNIRDDSAQERLKSNVFDPENKHVFDNKRNDGTTDYDFSSDAPTEGPSKPKRSVDHIEVVDFNKKDDTFKTVEVAGEKFQVPNVKKKAPPTNSNPEVDGNPEIDGNSEADSKSGVEDFAPATLPPKAPSNASIINDVFEDAFQNDGTVISEMLDSEDPFASRSGNFSGSIASGSMLDRDRKSKKRKNKFQKMNKQMQQSAQREDTKKSIKKEVNKVLETLHENPEKVNKAVAEWVKNGNNSR